MPQAARYDKSGITEAHALLVTLAVYFGDDALWTNLLKFTKLLTNESAFPSKNHGYLRDVRYKLKKRKKNKGLLNRPKFDPQLIFSTFRTNEYITEIQEKADSPPAPSTIPAPVSEAPPTLPVTLPAPSNMAGILRTSKRLAAAATDRNLEESTLFSYTNEDGEIVDNPNVNSVSGAFSNLSVANNPTILGKATNLTQCYYSSKQGKNPHGMHFIYAGYKAADDDSQLQVKCLHVIYHPKSAKDLDALQLKLVLEKGQVSSSILQLDHVAVSHADVVDVDPYLGGIAANSMKEVTATGGDKIKQETQIKNEFSSRQMLINDQVSKDYGVDMSKPKMARTKIIAPIDETTHKPIVLSSAYWQADAPGLSSSDVSHLKMFVGSTKFVAEKSEKYDLEMTGERAYAFWNIAIMGKTLTQVIDTPTKTAATKATGTDITDFLSSLGI